jgi:hypothetical protein
MKKLIKLILFILCFIFLISLFWYRFIRERLPRDIPYKMSVFSFIIILLICTGLIFSIISIIVEHKPKQYNILIIIQKYFYKPSGFFINYIKDNEITASYFKRYLILFVDYVEKLNYNKVYLFMELIPRIIIVSTFFLDVIYYHHMYYFYKILLLGIIVLIVKNILFCFKHLADQTISIIEERAEIYCFNIVNDKEPGVTLILSGEEFVNQQVYRIINGKPLINSGVVSKMSFVNAEKKRLNLPDTFRLNLIKLRDETRKVINMAIALLKIINLYEKEKEKEKYKYMSMIISTIYLICWVYILIVSFHKIDFVSFIEQIKVILLYTTQLPIEIHKFGYIVLMLMCIYYMILVVQSLLTIVYKKRFDPIIKLYYKLLEYLYNSYIQDKQYNIIKIYINNYSRNFIKNYNIIYILGNVLPRVILITVFLVEVFYYCHIILFYKLIPLLIVSIIIRYMYYSFNKYLNEQCNLLDNSMNIYTVVNGNITTVTITAMLYCKETVMRRLGIKQINIDWKFVMSEAYVDIYFEQKGMNRKVDEFNYKEAVEQRQKLLNDLTVVYEILYLYNEQKMKYDTWLTLIINLLYSISLGYILFTCTIDSIPIEFVLCLISLYVLILMLIRKEVHKKLFKQLKDFYDIVDVKLNNIIADLSFKYLFIVIYLYIYKHIKNYLIIYILGNILPRLILIAVFIIEIGYYNHISLFYKLLPLELIPMLVRYISYSLNKYLKEEYDILDDAIYFYIMVNGTITSTVITTQDHLHLVMLGRLGLELSTSGSKIEFKKVKVTAESSLEDMDDYSKKLDYIKNRLIGPSYVYQIVYLYNQQKIKYDIWVYCIQYILYSIFIGYIIYSCIVDLCMENLELFKLIINKEEPFSGSPI